MFDVSEIHAYLDTAEEKYKAIFDGNLSNGRPAQFHHFLAGLRMAVDHSADEASKESNPNG